jgi:UDP-glucose 4-epimerase
LTSSSEIYGKNVSSPLTEDSDRVIGAPQKLRWSYSDSKAIDEAMALALHREVELEVRIVRLFNTVGPGQLGTYGMVLPRFVQAALANSNLEIYGSGRQTRCFLHVADAVEGILKVDSAPEAIGLPLNLGNSREISIIDLADLVIKTLNSRSSKVFLNFPYSENSSFEDMERRVPDLTKISSIIGWAPSTSLEKTIHDVATYFQNQGISS